MMTRDEVHAVLVDGFLPRAALLLGTIAVAAGAFFGTALLLRVEELEDIAGLVKRKLGRLAKR